MLGTASVTSATFLMFWFGDFPKLNLLLWYGAAGVLILLRWLTSRPYDPNKLTMSNYRFWLNLSLFWSFMGGVHWGLIPVFFLTDEVTIYTLFTSFILTGYTASAISTNAAYPPAFVGFAFPASMMFAARFLYHGDDFHLAVGYMIVFFFAVSCLLSRSAKQTFLEARELNFKNMALMDELVVQKDAAEQATLSKDRFLAAASHDLRQPLHSAGLLLSALDQYVEHNDGKELLDDLHQSNEALNHSFNSLLDVSRLDAGVIEARPKHLWLKDLLAPLGKEYQIQATQKGLQLGFHIEANAVHSDPILLERVLHNLISNAIAYTAAGSVTIRVKKLDGNLLRLTVSDTGLGIAAEELNEIFSEYYQINNPERDRNKGFGLGLAIVKRLCDILGIRIHISSQLGNGTTFALYLPLGDESAARQKQQQTWSLANLSGTTVLVIDDDRGVTKSMERLLSSWGCRVLCAESEEQAVQAIVETDVEPDVIIADFRLREDKTGVEAVNRVFDELNQTIPSIIVTGDTSPDRLQKLRASGFPVLHKPVSPALLRSAIQRQLGAVSE